MEEHGQVRILRNSNIARVIDDAGRPLVIFKEQEYSPTTFQRVVYALGGTTPSNLLRTLGIEFNEEGPIFDPSGETKVQGLFLIGDLAVGRAGGSIILAFNSATRAMRRIREGYLNSKPADHSRSGWG
jgi:thioredoxin reductase (NADPH)